MKALTLYDPWATLVVLGEKQFETRSWSTSHRGLLAIHVSKKFTNEMADLCHQEPFKSALVDLEDWPQLGCIIGTVEVVGMYPTGETDFFDSPLTAKEWAFGDYSSGRWAWKLRNPRRLAMPIPCKGAMGLWTVPPEIEAKLKEVA